MKKLILVLAIVFVIGRLSARAQSSIAFFTTGGPCLVPTTGQTILCGSATSLQVSFNGAPYRSLQGPAGPPGPTGATGATGASGPAGPQGPSGTVPATITCSTLAVSATGVVVLGGCH
jgi:hypothetical protein